MKCVYCGEETGNDRSHHGAGQCVSALKEALYKARKAGDGDLAALQEALGHWGRATFGERRWSQGIAHLRREVEELSKARTPDDREEELADCFLFVLSLGYEQGVDLLEAGHKKLALLQTRSWGPPDAEGVIEHIREGG